MCTVYIIIISNFKEVDNLYIHVQYVHCSVYRKSSINPCSIFCAYLGGKCRFGQLPILEVDGTVLGQSMAILRYLAKEHGTYSISSSTLPMPYPEIILAPRSEGHTNARTF